MYSMFSGASSFNQPLGFWDVSGVMIMLSIPHYRSLGHACKTFGKSFCLLFVLLMA
jgi:hypothetical protein